MRAIVQRVKEATIAVDDKITGQIGTGMLVSLDNDGLVTIVIDSKNPE